MIWPADFIPIAEETGLIVPIGEWVIRTACIQASRWPRDISVAVNLSPAQFKSPGLVVAVAKSLEESGIAAGRLELEITESVLLQLDSAAPEILKTLKLMGVRIALDDFGTGYSSLGYLRSYKFDKLKIDQSFVRETTAEEDCAAIIRSLIQLAADLGMSTTAEGVETADQLENLRLKGCVDVQGYFISRPVAASSATRLLATQEADARKRAAS